MLLLQCAAALALLLLCTLAPGLLLVRRLRWSALEKLCGAIAFSLILLWLAAWTIYLLAPDSFSALCYAVSAICLVLAAVVWRDARALFASIRVRRALQGFAFLFGWTLLVLAIIRVYSGASWQGDWLEHFQRSLFFLHHFPRDTVIFGDWKLPARPPAMNVLASFFLAQAGDRFEIFQLISAFLNLLLFFPCCLLLPMFSRSRNSRILPLVAIFATSPIVMQNATYTWTKLLAAFFLILGLALYLRGWRKSDTSRTVLAFLSLAAGLLVHYSAGPYVIFFALHYLVVIFPRRRSWKELAWIGSTSGALLATWFVWSLAVFGVSATVASNSSINTGRRYPGSTAEKIAGNVVDSIVPHLIRGGGLTHFFDQPDQTATLRDNLFIVYQTNLIFSMGAIGGPLVVWFLVAAFRRRWSPPVERTFWLWLIASTVLIGIAVVGERDLFGVAHLTLLPMEILGLTLLAARFRTSPTVAWLVIAGCALDFTLGVLLHVRVQHLENTPERTSFSGLVISNGHFDLGVPGPDSLSTAAWWNWLRKHQLAYAEKWKHDLQAYTPTAAAPAGKPEVLAVLDKFIGEDDRLFRGWYRRHGGETGFIGDRFPANDATQALLVLLCAGMLWKLSRQVPPLSPIPSAKPTSWRSRRKQ